MENKYIDNCNNDLQMVRDKIIVSINSQIDKVEFIRANANAIFNSGLTMYSSYDSIKSIIYNSINKSKLDQSFSLHPEQIKILKTLKKEDALIISAPTSFGKTFCVFEYIYRYKPKCVVMIVPTLALVDEYKRKVLNKYKSQFQDYRKYTNIDKNQTYDFTNPSIFILTHDKVIAEDVLSIISHIDFLVIDEVYKLENNINNDRVIVLNVAYYKLAQISSKYVLLAPFIDDVINRNQLVNYPAFYKTDYSPVFNKVYKREIRTDDRRERFLECNKIINELQEKSKTLIYFPRVVDLNTYIKEIIEPKEVIETNNELVKRFISWAKKEIHNDWIIIKALERGYLVHNGQITRGAKTFGLYLFEKDSEYNKMLCTSTLLEGVNTTTENIIITRPYNNNEQFSAFDFYNLVGRSGRLNQYYVGNAYYIKSPNDNIYDNKELATRKIEFELTTNSDDIKLALGSLNSIDFHIFLSELGITIEDYKKNIGIRNRFTNTVKNLYNTFKIKKNDLIDELETIKNVPKTGIFRLVRIIYEIINPEDNKYCSSSNSLIIKNLLNKNRLSIKAIINNCLDKKDKNSIDKLINRIIYYKYSNIEHEFYNKSCILLYFLELEHVSSELLNVFREKIITTIEIMYYINDINRRMLLDFGIYERDIEKIIKIIGTDFSSVDDMMDLLNKKYNEYKGKISFMSRFIIKNSFNS